LLSRHGGILQVLAPHRRPPGAGSRVTTRGKPLFDPGNGSWACCRVEFIRLPALPAGWFMALCANEFAPTINRIILLELGLMG